MVLKSYNPANNKIIGEVEQTSLSEINNIVYNSRIAFENWGYLKLTERLSYIQKLYDKIKIK